MIHISYKLKASGLHGVGLFADENIKHGQLIYTASPLLDLNLTQEQFDSLDKKEQDEILWWGFFDQPSQMWHVDFDVSKFINHSYSPTVTQGEQHDEAYLIATRDIAAGEELTQNYLEFEMQEDLARRDIPLEAKQAEYLYHIAKRSDWKQAQQNGFYAAGSLQRSFEKDGFIHLSYARQVNIIADMIYRETPDLVLLKINPAKLTAEVKDEVADVPHGTFPHLYGRLNVDAVESVSPYEASSNGHFPKIEG